MPFEQGVPIIPGRSRKTYAMLDRAIRFDTTVGCKGYDKIGEEVKHSEACHERFRVFLEEKFRKAVEDAEAKKLSAEVRERLEAQEEAGVFELEERTREIEAEATETEVPDVPAGTVRPIPKKSHENSEEPSNDFWEFDKGKGACGKIHIKSRKRLFAPVGNDCPFGTDDVSSKRVIEWKCRGKSPYHIDDWQSNPYQRISSKSWVGKT